MLNKWKDGEAGHLKAFAAALVNALIYAGIVGVAAATFFAACKRW